MRVNHRGAFYTRRPVNRRRINRRPLPRSIPRTRVRLHQSVKQVGNGGSFSYFYYARRKRPFMRGYAINPTQYNAINSAGAMTINVGLQTVCTITCLYGCVANALSQDLDSIFGSKIMSRRLSTSTLPINLFGLCKTYS